MIYTAMDNSKGKENADKFSSGKRKHHHKHQHHHKHHSHRRDTVEMNMLDFPIHQTGAKSIEELVKEGYVKFPFIQTDAKTVEELIAEGYVIPKSRHSRPLISNGEKPEIPGVKQIIKTDGGKVIVLFKDGTKQIATCHENDTYSFTAGVLVCLLKHEYGSKSLNRFIAMIEEDEKSENPKIVYVQASKKKESENNG